MLDQSAYLITVCYETIANDSKAIGLLRLGVLIWLRIRDLDLTYHSSNQSAY